MDVAVKWILFFLIGFSTSPQKAKLRCSKREYFISVTLVCSLEWRRVRARRIGIACKVPAICSRLHHSGRALFVARWTNGRSENDTTAAALIFSWNRWQKIAFVCLTLRTSHLNLPLLWPFLFKASALSLNVVQRRVCCCH
jgi:hypothetical protein